MTTTFGRCCVTINFRGCDSTKTPARKESVIASVENGERERGHSGARTRRTTFSCVASSFRIAGSTPAQALCLRRRDVPGRTDARSEF